MAPTRSSFCRTACSEETMTITAKEARELTNKSEKAVQTALVPVYDLIRTNAQKGETSCFWHLDTIEQSYHIPVESMTQAMIDTLHKHGFHCQVRTQGEAYVPRGLADDEGNGPKHINYGIAIYW